MQSVAIRYGVSNSVITKNSVCCSANAHFIPYPYRVVWSHQLSNVGRYN